MSKRDGLRIAGAVLTGLMLAVSFPGWGQSTVVFTALVPLLLAVQSVSSKRAAGLAWLSGMVFFGLSFVPFVFVIAIVAPWPEYQRARLKIKTACDDNVKKLQVAAVEMEMSIGEE